MSVRNDWVDCAHQGWCSVRLADGLFQFRVNSPSQQEIPFHEACDQAANLLVTQWGDRPLYLGLSGGMDSELVANVLTRNGVDFTPVIVDIQGCNQDESWYAHYWCWKNQRQPLHLTISAERFEAEVLPMARHLQCTIQRGLLPLLWLQQQITDRGGCLIMAVGDINLDDQQGFYNNVVDWFFDIWRPGLHPSGFLSYTADLTASYIRSFDMRFNEQYNKAMFYGIAARPKFHWFDRMCNLTDRTIKMFEYLSKKGHHSPHWFGSQRDTLSTLCNKKEKS